MTRFFLRSLLVAATFIATPNLAVAQSALTRPDLVTNEAYVGSLRKRPILPLADTREMFSRILASLPARVTVFPTENYYYFSFMAEGVRYAGNIRLDAATRDLGRVHFAYFIDLQEWSGNEDVRYMVLDASHGVTVSRLDALVYSVSDGRSTVTFALNDLRGVVPPPVAIMSNERYIGPIFDESAVRFFLVFNMERKVFHYILDETDGVDDRLEPSRFTDRILIGRRTGFAYYRDHRTERKILIGVHESNARVNNYFDGPFDQLPDNFIEGESLRSAILQIDPELNGKIDRYGASPDGSSRYMIAPYRHYTFEDELLYFHNCATWPKLKPSNYASCFVYADSLPPPRKIKKSNKTK